MHFRFFIIFVSHAEMLFATSHAPVGATTLSDMKGAVEKQKQYIYIYIHGFATFPGDHRIDFGSRKRPAKGPAGSLFTSLFCVVF